VGSSGARLRLAASESRSDRDTIVLESDMREWRRLLEFAVA
jgi:hypothetical protein